MHARENAEAKALCGERPNDGKWTRKQTEVTCLLCLDEVTRRKAKFVHYGQPRDFTLCGKGGTKVSMWGAVTCPTCLKMKAGAWVPPSSRH